MIARQCHQIGAVLSCFLSTLMVVSFSYEQIAECLFKIANIPLEVDPGKILREFVLRIHANTIYINSVNMGGGTPTRKQMR